MPDWLLPTFLTVLFGSLAGGITNTVAIWMLFHPYEPPRIGRWRLRLLQGAVPKNQERLAAAIGRTVGGRLLTDEDLTRIFSRPEFREAFDARLEEYVSALLHEERESLRQVLPADVLMEVEEALDDVGEHVASRLEAYVDSETFEGAVSRRAEDLLRAVADEPIAGVLTPAREEALTGAVEEWIEGAVESEGFREALDDYLRRASVKLLQPERTFEEILPLGLVASLEKAISGYLPLAIERLGSLLEDPETRARFQRFIHELLHGFLRDLRFHQRVVARLILTEDTVDRVLDAVEEEGAQRLSEMLRDPTMQDAMARGVNDAIVDFLRRPVVSVIGDSEDPAIAEARDTLVGWVVGMARDPATRSFLVEKMESGLERAGAKTWGELLGRLPRERVAAGLIAAARSDPARRLYHEAARGILQRALDRRIGRPSRLLPDDVVRRIERGLSEPIWNWLQTQVPDVVGRLDVAKRVEEKVLEFPTARMEELVRRVTERELKMIVRLGYVLGAVIGLVLVGVNAWVG